jgi:MFS transporter, DHA1 family, inner membrane transport protein
LRALPAHPTKGEGAVAGRPDSLPPSQPETTVRLTPPLAALAVGAFGIGTTEFVIMGLLPDVARDLDVSIPTAGLIVTGYAAGVVVGAPVLAILTARFPRKGALVALMAIFAFGNLLCALAPSYGLLMAARVLTAFSHAAFFGIGAVAAADLAPQNQRAQAMSLMFAGLTLANVLGVRGGTALGQVLGWRASFAVVALIGAIALSGIAFFVPRDARPPTRDLLSEFSVLGEGRVLIGMAMSAASAASFFSVFTYIAPILEDVTGFAPRAVTWLLVIYGIGLTLGNVAGGRLADWNALRTIGSLFFAVMAVLATFTAASHYAIPTTLLMFVWGAVSFALVSPLQMRVMDMARGAPNLVSTLNQGAFNVGCASGAWFGGIPLRFGASYDSLPWVGVALAALGLGLTLLSARLDRRRAEAAPATC